MTRPTFGTANRAEVAKAVVRTELFSEFAFPGGTIRVTTADRNITWGGYTWVAQGLLRDVGTSSERSDLKSVRSSMILSGLDSTLLARIAGNDYHGARVQQYIGFFDENWKLVADPYAFGDELLMSNCVLKIAEGEGSIELSAETWDIFNQRDSAVLATPESQRMRYAGDAGMDRATFIATMDIEWGGGKQRVGLPTGVEDDRPTKRGVLID